MSQQLIGVGTVANDGTGDPLRSAFIKVNANETELYAGNIPNYIAGNWYLPLGQTASSTTSASSANTIRFCPGFITTKLTISNLAGRVTANAAGNAQFAIYANNAATNRPTGSALVSTASMSTATAGTISSAASLQLGPGLYWFGFNTDTATLTFNGSTGSTGSQLGSTIGSSTLASVVGSGSGMFNNISIGASTFGTWPNVTSSTFTEAAGNAQCPQIAFQVASVP